MHRSKEQVLNAFEAGMNRSSIVQLPNGYRANYVVQRADGIWKQGQVSGDSQAEVVQNLQDVTYCYANSRVCECRFDHS